MIRSIAPRPSPIAIPVEPVGGMVGVGLLTVVPLPLAAFTVIVCWQFALAELASLVLSVSTAVAAYVPALS